MFTTGYGGHRDLHVRTHPFPTRRSSDLANKGVLESAAGTKQTSAGGKLILIAVAGVSLAAAFLLGWLYIGRRVGLPLIALTGGMARLANREWQTDVTDRSRADEIGDMAPAGPGFKRKAAENEQLTS